MLEHLNLWDVKRKPPPRANSPPTESFIIYDQSLSPSADDYLLNLGELFTLVAYGQLIIENAEIHQVADDLLDQIFDFMIRDFAKLALQIFNKPSSRDP